MSLGTCYLSLPRQELTWASFRAQTLLWHWWWCYRAWAQLEPYCCVPECSAFNCTEPPPSPSSPTKATTSTLPEYDHGKTPQHSYQTVHSMAPTRIPFKLKEYFKGTWEENVLHFLDLRQNQVQLAWLINGDCPLLLPTCLLHWEVYVQTLSRKKKNVLTCQTLLPPWLGLSTTT